MKKYQSKFLCVLSLLLTFALTLQAQAPDGYYRAAKGTKGAELKTALFQIVADHTQRSYKQLWEDFKQTDVRADGKIWDMYSNATDYVPGGPQQGVNYKGEGDSYNREHSFPKSWFDDGYPMYTDLFHLYPTDGYINGRRSNYPFGETNGETFTSKNGFSKLGKSTLPGYSGTVFEPNDEYKGDFARTYFYMATAYEDQIASWNSPMLAGNAYPAYADWVVTMLLRWAADDPVSEKEVARNNAVYKIQHNRNPYIDFPGLEQYVWGNRTDVAFDPENYDPSNPGPTPNPQPEEVAAPVFSPAPGMVAKGTEVTVTTATTGAEICYTLNDGTEQRGASPVVLTVNENLSITAYARAGEQVSREVKAVYTLKPDVPQGNTAYVPVTDAARLAAGSELLIVCPEKGTAMAEQVKDYRGLAEVTVPADGGSLVTEVNAEGLPYAFVLGGTTGDWTLYDQTEGLYLALNKNDNKLHTSQTADAPNALWTISITAEGKAEVVNQLYDNRLIQYNDRSPRFACYKGTQKAIALYARMMSTDIAQMEQAAGGEVRIYDLNGRFVGKSASVREALRQLPRGFYLINGTKVLVR